MKNFQKVIAVIALSGMCLAAPAPSETDTTVKKGTKHHAKKKEEAVSAAPAGCPACEEIKQLKERLQTQQGEIDQLKNAPRVDNSAQVQQTAAEAAAAQKAAADAAAAAAEANSKAAAAQSDVAGMKSEVAANSELVQQAKKKVDYLEHPASIAYKGIRITPGGFFDLIGYYRTRATNSGPATTFQSIPTGNAAAFPQLSETGLTARGTRLSVRADADAGSTKLAGFFEGDFQGLTIATPNQTTAYGLRIRQGWGRAKFADGWSITGGQMWNLVTMNRRAADSDAPWIPNTIDTQYMVGFDWGRQAELRVAKTIGKQFTLAASIIDPSTLNLGVTNTNGQVAGLASAGSGNLGNSVVNGNCTVTAGTGTTVVCPLTDTYTTNIAPDGVVKLAYDSPRLGHFEAKALGRVFRDRVLTGTGAGKNNEVLGGGVGGGWIIPVVHKKVDFITQGMWGKGISRYENAGQYDIVVPTNLLSTGTTTTPTTTGGTNYMQKIKSFSAIAGFETHPTPKVEIDVWGGTEYYYRSTYKLTNIAAPHAVVTGGYGAANVANNRDLIEGTAVIWYDLYKGSFGTMRYGAQYEYDFRDLWRVGKVAAKGSDKAIDNVGMLEMRYILP